MLLAAALLVAAVAVAVAAGLSFAAAFGSATFAVALGGGVQLRRGTLPARRAHTRRGSRGALKRALAFTSLNIGSVLIRRVLRPDYLFLAYAETEREKRAYFPRWIERLLRPLFPSGLIRFGRFWGVMVAGKVTAESFEDSPERLQKLLDDAQNAYPNVHVIALAGRLPSIAVRNGFKLESPFVRGDRGTLCAMLFAAREQARLLGKPPAELTIAVPGGAGFIGEQLTHELSREFQSVVALDPRFGEAREWRGNVLYTSYNQDIALAQAVLVLTARGEDTADMVPFLMPGTVVADDTHPEIPESIRSRMERAGATVLKATIGDSRFRFLPSVPGFRGDDIPGCLLETLVLLERGEGVLDEQRSFNAAAHELGFRARLAPARRW